MLRFGKTKVAKRRTLCYNKTKKKYVVVSNRIETNINSKHLIGYLDDVIKPLVFQNLPPIKTDGHDGVHPHLKMKPSDLKNTPTPHPPFEM